MKKIFTLGLMFAVLIFQQTSAQLKKGEKMLGANIALLNSKQSIKSGSNTYDEDSYTFVRVGPQFGVGVGNNWIMGLSSRFDYTKTELLVIALML